MEIWCSRDSLNTSWIICRFDESESLKTSGTEGITASLHGLHEVWSPRWFGGQLNLDGQNGLQIPRKLGVRSWIGNHDEIKTGERFVVVGIETMDRERRWGFKESDWRNGRIKEIRATWNCGGCRAEIKFDFLGVRVTVFPFGIEFLYKPRKSRFLD